MFRKFMETKEKTTAPKRGFAKLEQTEWTLRDIKKLKFWNASSMR